MMKTTRRGRLVLISGAAVVLIAVVGTWVFLANRTPTPVKPPVIAHCSPVAEEHHSFVLTPEQASNASMISAVAMRRGMANHVVTIALMTALQESKLYNLDYGDRDSLGLFQQRPSQGWGTEKEIMDPIYSTNAFYDALVKVPKYMTRDEGDVAQDVQHSGFPDAYDKHEPSARTWAISLTGENTTPVTCILPGRARNGDPQAVMDLIHRDFGPGVVTTILQSSATPSSIVRIELDGSALASAIGKERMHMQWTLAQWSIVHAYDLQISRVRMPDESSWVWRDTAPPSATMTSTATPTPKVGDGRVILSVAVPTPSKDS